MKRNSGRVQVLRAYKLIVWGECTMAHHKSIEALNATLKDFRSHFTSSLWRSQVDSTSRT
jgi:hypothetical protein